MNKTNYIEAVAGNAVSVTAGAYQYDRGIKLRVDGTAALSPPNFHFAIDGIKTANKSSQAIWPTLQPVKEARLQARNLASLTG